MRNGCKKFIIFEKYIKDLFIKNMIKQLNLILIMVFVSQVVFSQISAFEKGNEIFYKGPLAYKQALPYYLNALDSLEKDAYLNFKIGRCYLYTDEKNRAIQYFRKAFDLNERKRSTAQYFLAKAFQHDQQFDSAIYHYTEYLKSIRFIRKKKEKKEVLKRIAACENAKKYLANEKEGFSRNAGREMNTEYSDYMPVMDTKGAVLYSTTRSIKKNSNKQYIDSLVFEAYEDILSQKRKHAPVNVTNFNTLNHDAVVSISHNGKYMIVYRSENGGDLYLSERVGEDWSDFKAFPKPINTKHHESSAYISSDGKTLYFVSNRKYRKKHDIYISTKNDKGKWRRPKALSDSINTKYDEESIFLHPDGMTLFFASKGHATMGGYDIFYSRLIDGEWSKAVNLGYPINSTENDLYFNVSSDGKYAFFSSDKAGGFGGHDLYATQLATDVFQKTFLKGIVSDAVTKTPLQAKIELYDSKNNLVLSIMSSPDSGKYFKAIPSGEYSLLASAPGYLFFNKHLSIEKTRGFDTIIQNIEIKKQKKNSSIVLSEIEFDYNKASLRESSYPALDRIAEYLKNNPDLDIEISGHTDNTGSKKVNTDLSQKRAQSVVDYLVSKGVKNKRLTAKGYADEKPIDTNKTAEGRQNNRRVEFKIIK